MDKQHLEELIKSIRTLMRCPNCGFSYRTSFIKILEEGNMACVVHLECSRCGMPVLATIVAKTEKIGDPRIITGMKEKDFTKEEEADPITVDDVLNMHKFLKNFDGNFESILD